MSIAGRVRSLLRLILKRDEVETELDAEVQSYFETMVDRYRELGMTEQEARRMARLQFTSPGQVTEEIRDTRPGAGLASFMRDLSYSLRRLRKAPAFSIVTVLTIALGISANATIFSIVSRFVLRPAPVGDPAKLMALHTAHHGECCNNFSWPLYNDVREQTKLLSGVAAYYELVPASIGGNGEPERVWGQAVTSNFFDVSQTGMTLGRGFTGDEERVPVVVLGYGLWQQRFGGDPAITGKQISLSGHTFTAVGVTPPAFHGIDTILDCRFWVPLGNLDVLLPKTIDRASYSYHWLNVIARLQPGVTNPQVAAELDVVGRRVFKAHPEERDADAFRFEQAGSLPPRDKSPVMLFLAALTLVALLVLGIAGANVASMFMAQVAARQREIAVRIALGATRRHLLFQMTIESLLLALAGGAVGLAISIWATRALTVFRFPAPIPLDLSVTVDFRVLLYALLLSVATGFFFGLVPAWIISRPIIANGLKGERTLERPGRIWSLGNVLVVSQIATSIVLLCATGLFLRSLQNASQIDIGFRSHGIVTMAIDPRLHQYSGERTTRFLNTLRARLVSLPGVSSATYTDSVPLSGGHRADGFHVEGGPSSEASNVTAELYMVGPGYFETIGTPVIAGRDFAGELPDGPKVAIINQVLAQRLFKNENPIGRRLTGPGVTYQVIGVAKNIKSRTLGEEFKPVLYRTLAQNIAADASFSGYCVLVHFTQDPAAVNDAMRHQIHSLDPSLAIFNVETIEEHLRDALFLPRLGGMLFGAFGVLGLSLASVGLYGVINSWVSRRKREMGIRLAMGARVSQLQRLILRQGMQLTLIAVAPGVLGAWFLSKLFTAALYGVNPHDTLTFALVPIFLVAVALLSCWIPARRAAGLEPLEALRDE